MNKTKQNKKIIIILGVLMLFLIGGILVKMSIGSDVASDSGNDSALDQKSCTLSVSCESLLENMALLDEEKWEVVPEDGIIFAEKEVNFTEGESVFDVFQRELINADIQMEFANTPVYDSAYIEGVANLYEFDAGPLSGWLYEVNGVVPNYGSSKYFLEDGDVINWLYTCDRGSAQNGGDAIGSEGNE